MPFFGNSKDAPKTPSAPLTSRRGRRSVPLKAVRGILVGGMSSCFEKYRGYMNHYINFEKFQRNHRPRDTSPEKRRDKALCPQRVKHFYSWECVTVQCATRTYDFTLQDREQLLCLVVVLQELLDTSCPHFQRFPLVLYKRTFVKMKIAYMARAQKITVAELFVLAVRKTIRELKQDVEEQIGRQMLHEEANDSL